MTDPPTASSSDPPAVVGGDSGLTIPPRSRNPPSAYPRIGQAIGLLVIAGILILIFDIPVWIVTPRDSPIRFVASFVFQALAIGVVVYGGYVHARLPFASVFPLRRFRMAFLGSMILLLVGALILAVDLGALLQSFWPKPESLRALEKHILAGEGNVAGAVFVLVVLAPISEEFLFRGLIMHGFLQNYSRRKAILVSALLFALFHVNPWQFPMAFVLGVVLGWWLVETGSLWPCLVGHGLANSVPFLLRLGVRSDMARAKPAPVPGPMAIGLIGVAALVFLGAGAWLLRRSRTPRAT